MKILIDNGHGKETVGKRSPDGRLLEWEYNRMLARGIVAGLQADGLDAELLVPEDRDVPLPERVLRADGFCHGFGTGNVILVSVHVNAAGRGDRWYNATGWSAYTTPGQTPADHLATCLYNAAQLHLPGKRLRMDYTDADPDLERAFYILQHTRCPAVLTENFFMDSKADLDFLLTPDAQQALISLHLDGLTAYLSTP